MRILTLIVFIGTLLSQNGMGQVGNCDSLQLFDMKLNPFNTEYLMVRAGYTDFDNFINYPGFAITDEDEFILALEEVNYFGMSLEQIHMLEIVNMEVSEGQPVDGNLELWSGFFDQLECEYAGPFTWWPEQDCVPLRLTVNTFDGDTISGKVEWSIASAEGNVEAQGTYALSSEESIVNWDFCLEAGCGYQFDISTGSLLGQGFSYTLHYGDFLAIGANGIMQESSTDLANFDLYNCTITAKEEPGDHQWSVFPNPARDQFVIAFEEPLEPSDDFRIFDVNGRQMPITTKLPRDRTQHTISCEQWSSGVYQLIRTGKDGSTTHHRLVVE